MSYTAPGRLAPILPSHEWFQGRVNFMTWVVLDEYDQARDITGWTVRFRLWPKGAHAGTGGDPIAEATTADHITNGGANGRLLLALPAVDTADSEVTPAPREYTYFLDRTDGGEPENLAYGPCYLLAAPP